MPAAARNHDVHLYAAGDKMTTEGARADPEAAAWPDAQELGGDDANAHADENQRSSRDPGINRRLRRADTRNHRAGDLSEVDIAIDVAIERFGSGA